MEPCRTLLLLCELLGGCSCARCKERPTRLNMVQTALIHSEACRKFPLLSDTA